MFGFGKKKIKVWINGCLNEFTETQVKDIILESIVQHRKERELEAELTETKSRLTKANSLLKQYGHPGV